MTFDSMHSADLCLPDRADSDLELYRPPVALWLAGTMVVLNVCATVLSLMA